MLKCLTSYQFNKLVMHERQKTHYYNKLASLFRLSDLQKNL